MTDVLTLFNQLTHSELADYSIFENVLDNHYEKFKYFYHLMEDIDLINIDKIRCSESFIPNALEIRVSFENVKHLNDFNKKFTNITKSFRGYYIKYFIVSSTIDKKSLYISIENKNNISSEEDIYEDRFNSN